MITIDKITLAVNEMDSAANFYSAILAVKMQPMELHGETLYSGKREGVEVLLCPRQLAQVDSSIGNNTVQVRCVVDDIRTVHQDGLNAGGSEITPVGEYEGRLHSALRDPEGNSIELMQAANSA